MLRSLIHLDLSFVQGDKYGSICILLHADIQLDQHHLLKMLSFFHCMVLASLSKYRCPWVYGFVSFWVFDTILLASWLFLYKFHAVFYYYCSVVQLEVRDGDTSISRYCIGLLLLSCFFLFLYEVENCSFKVCKELCWNFDGDCIESVDCFWQDIHFYYIDPANP